MSDFLPELVLIVEILYIVMVDIFEWFFADELVFVDVLWAEDEIQGQFGIDGVVGFHAEDLVALLIEVDLNARIVLGHHPQMVQNGNQLFSVAQQLIQLDYVLFVDSIRASQQKLLLLHRFAVLLVDLRYKRPHQRVVQIYRIAP